jgi:hypothetical protein
MGLFDKPDLEGVVPAGRRTDEQLEAALAKFGEKPAREWDSFADFEQEAIHAQARGFKEIWMQLHNGTAEKDPALFAKRVQRICGVAANHGA